MNNKRGYFDAISEFYDDLPDSEIILAFDGDVTHQVMKAFVSSVEDRLERENENEASRNRLYHVLVECLQNINRHADDQEPVDVEFFPGRGGILLSRTNKKYCLVTANIIRNEEIPELKEMLEKINPMKDEELNLLYKKQLTEGQLSSKGGAGLGFIDIRRKTGNKMEFKFVSKEKETSFFLLNITVNR
ncbi:MAG: SiaB family protein kinase [Bacteroidales bacterium]|nr:SiaB family protein kinase [Bacteroidales bacterium]